MEPTKKAAPKKKMAVPPAKEAGKLSLDGAPARREARRSSPRRIGGAAGRRVMGGSISREGSTGRSTSQGKSNEYNKKFIEQLKAPATDLRVTGADPETEPTMELGLLLDCTSSMGSWIAKAKETIVEIIDKVIKECEEDGQLKARVSFIGYRDIRDNRRFEVMPFNENIDQVKTFI
jgi:hypothetical protein